MKVQIAVVDSLSERTAHMNGQTFVMCRDCGTSTFIGVFPSAEEKDDALDQHIAENHKESK